MYWDGECDECVEDCLDCCDDECEVNYCFIKKNGDERCYDGTASKSALDECLLECGNHYICYDCCEAKCYKQYCFTYLGNKDCRDTMSRCEQECEEEKNCEDEEACKEGKCEDDCDKAERYAAEKE